MYSWGHSRRFNSYPEYFKNLFGSRIQKVSVNAGFTCPNRDGKVGSKGCTFCDNEAFSPSYCSNLKPISQQIEEGIEFHKNRYRRVGQYLAYFQSFSNTYAPIDVLRKRYEEALKYPDVIGLVIGTRPDCIDRETLKLLQEISEKHYISLEFGVESTNNEVLKKINRGHTYEQAVEAIKLSAEYGLNTGAHFIFGLPSESMESMTNSVEIISKLPLCTIKFHQLQILKNTQLYDDFVNKKVDVKLFEIDEYIDFIIKFAERLNPNFVIERFNAEVPPRYLMTESWNKLRLYEIQIMIENEMEKRDTWQGKFWKK